MGLVLLFTCMYSPVSNNWRISKHGRHMMTRRKISASWMVRYKLFFFLVYPPSLTSHPHTRVSMAMSLFDLSCLSCLSSSGLSPGAKLCGPGTQPRALYWLCWTLPTQNMGSHLPRELLQVNNPQYILCMLKCLQG